MVDEIYAVYDMDKQILIAQNGGMRIFGNLEKTREFLRKYSDLFPEKHLELWNIRVWERSWR